MNWAGDSKLYPEVIDELGISETIEWDKKAFAREVGRLTPEQTREMGCRLWTNK